MEQLATHRKQNEVKGVPGIQEPGLLFAASETYSIQRR